MLLWTVGCALVLVSNVYSEGYPGSNQPDTVEVDCDDALTMMRTIELCHHEPVNDFYFTNDYGNIYGAEIRYSMQQVCRNFRYMDICVEQVSETCPQHRTILTNAAVKKRSRFCSGYDVSRWYRYAIPRDLVVNRTCQMSIITGTINNCTGHAGWPQGEIGTLSWWMEYGQLQTSGHLNCVLHTLMNTNIPEHYTGCPVTARDVMTVYISYLARSRQFEIRHRMSDNVFALIKAYLMNSF